MSKPPLWEVLHKAHNDVADPFGAAVLAAYAAEIRALRDWLVPDEEGDPPIVGYKPTRDALVVHAMWKQRQYLRTLLTAEANRAERGEVEA